jgi:hypothetical protein
MFFTGKSRYSEIIEKNKMENLEDLRMDKNQLMYLPKEISKLENIKIMFFNSNKIKFIPKSYNKLENLKFISLLNNSIDIENEIMNKLDEGLDDIQAKAINKYSNNFNEDYYYSTIIIDKTYLNMYNKLINKYLNNQIKIVLHNRVKDKLSNKWIVKSLNLLI